MRNLQFAAVHIAMAVAALSSAAMAATSDDNPKLTVSFSDLNLRDPAGVATLYRRVHAAAETVCGKGSVDLRQLEQSARYRACVNTAVDGAVAAVPTLVAYVREHHPSRG